MSTRTHYHVLGVAPDAPSDHIRSAYRQLAREHHPDRVRSSSAAGSRDMPTINEAYRVLNDPGRRAIYDRSLRADPSATTTRASGTSETPGAAGTSASGAGYGGRSGSPYTVDQAMLRPARIPWRSLLVAGSLAIIGIVVLAQFSDGATEVGPDGILRNGDCVEILPNGDAAEIACTGDGDLVVRAFIPFDGTCPSLFEPHRDRQGMGVACIDRAEMSGTVRSE